MNTTFIQIHIYCHICMACGFKPTKPKQSNNSQIEKEQQKKMKFNIYNPNNNANGLEFRYAIEGNTLYIEVHGANSFLDWAKCIIDGLWSKHRMKIHVHPYWYLEAFKSYRYLKHVKKLTWDAINFRAMSMGSACVNLFCFIWLADTFPDELEITYKYIRDTSIIQGENYGGPKSNKEGLFLGLHYYNKGDIVPFLPPWFKKPSRILLNKNWQLPWKAHSSYKF